MLNGFKTGGAALLLSAAALGITYGKEAPVARIPAVPADSTDPILKPIFDTIRSRGGEPQNMHRTLGNAPKIFKPYTDLAFAIRNDASVERVFRELMILRMTHLFHGDYEFAAHSPMAISCGMTPEQVAAIKTWTTNRDLFDEPKLAILSYADGMASDKGVDDATMDHLRRHFSPQAIVELTITGSFYANASMVTRALGVKTDRAEATARYGKC